MKVNHSGERKQNTYSNEISLSIFETEEGCVTTYNWFLISAKYLGTLSAGGRK